MMLDDLQEARACPHVHTTDSASNTEHAVKEEQQGVGNAPALAKKPCTSPNSAMAASIMALLPSAVLTSAATVNTPAAPAQPRLV
jgi:hypothetical protein